MQSENLYIGDDKFQRFLDHYACPTPVSVVKMKFAGAICSPNENLRPADVIASLFSDNAQPRLTTKNEAELFFKFFMGLWDEMFTAIRTNTLKLPAFSGHNDNTEELIALCHSRTEQIEFGFVEGFWGGCDTLSIPNFAAELISSLSDMAGIYTVMAGRLEKKEAPEPVFQAVLTTDKTVEKTFRFLIENLVLPHIEKLQRNIN